MPALDDVQAAIAISSEARRVALEEAEARIRAISLTIIGGEGTPDHRFAQRAVEIAEAMRAECIAALRPAA